MFNRFFIAVMTCALLGGAAVAQDAKKKAEEKPSKVFREKLTKEVVEKGVKAYLDAQKEKDTGKSAIAFESNGQVIREINHGMRSKKTTITVAAEDFDVKEMVFGISVYARAISDTGGTVKSCPANPKQAGALELFTIVVPTLVDNGIDFVKEELEKLDIDELAEDYHILAYVKPDRRSTTKIVFKKRSLDNPLQC